MGFSAVCVGCILVYSFINYLSHRRLHLTVFRGGHLSTSLSIRIQIHLYAGIKAASRSGRCERSVDLSRVLHARYLHISVTGRGEVTFPTFCQRWHVPDRLALGNRGYLHLALSDNQSEGSELSLPLSVLSLCSLSQQHWDIRHTHTGK